MSDIKTIFRNLSTGAEYDVSAQGLAEDDSLATAVIISLFTDKRAVDRPGIEARGWWADDIGSLRWTLNRAKQTPEVARRLVQYDTDALQWLIEERLVKRVDITANWVARGVLVERITITLANDEPLVFEIEESASALPAANS